MHETLTTHGRGLLHAANSADSGVLALRMCGSATIPLEFHPDDHDWNVTVRVVRKLPDGLIKEDSFFRARQDIFDFGPGKGFKPEPSPPWVPFTDQSVGG